MSPLPLMLSILCLALPTSACSDPEPPPRAAATVAHPAPPPAAASPTPAPATTPSHAVLAAARGTAGSLYPLATPLEDHAGASISLPHFAGHPVIVSMFYARCGYACPTLIQDIRRIERQLDPEVRADVRVLLVTFDFEHDGPKALRELAERHAVDLERWALARAPDDERTRELAGALGIKYRKLEGGHFNHSSVITLLDREGVPLARIDGLSQDSTAFRAVVATASRAEPAP